MSKSGLVPFFKQNYHFDISHMAALIVKRLINSWE